ncbi:hypothetical protein OIU84_029095 [Salix udensis]|uniref:Uncharacterized protein n=1 Tax=Salix udensis TaxID=889485 RepID=A0AAD6J7J4_9ROSI|nr:hypothetical protein OIU84_029095 [Salix udensis]
MDHGVIEIPPPPAQIVSRSHDRAAKKTNRSVRARNNRSWRRWDFDHVRVHEHSLSLVSEKMRKKRNEREFQFKKRKGKGGIEREERLGIQRDVQRDDFIDEDDEGGRQGSGEGEGLEREGAAHEI